MRSVSRCAPPHTHNGRGGGQGRQLLGAADAQTAHPATSRTAPAHRPLRSANAETTPAGAPAAAADRTQRPDATCEGKNGGLCPPTPADCPGPAAVEGPFVFRGRHARAALRAHTTGGAAMARGMSRSGARRATTTGRARDARRPAVIVSHVPRPAPRPFGSPAFVGGGRVCQWRAGGGGGQHSPGTPTTGLRERRNDTSGSTGRSGRQNAATRRNMRREDRVTVQGPVKEQQPDGMSHGGGGGSVWASGMPLPPHRWCRCCVGQRATAPARDMFLQRPLHPATPRACLRVRPGSSWTHKPERAPPPAIREWP